MLLIIWYLGICTCIIFAWKLRKESVVQAFWETPFSTTNIGLSRLFTISVVISVHLLFRVPCINYRQFFFSQHCCFYKSLKSPFVFLRLTILSSFCFHVIRSDIFLLENSKYSWTEWVIEKSNTSERGTDQMLRVIAKLQETLAFWQKETNKQPQNRLKSSLITLL